MAFGALDKTYSLAKSSWNPVWSLRESEMKSLSHKVKNEWLGLVLKYEGHWGDGEKPPIFMIKEDTTLEEFKAAVEHEIKESGDDHHIFIESLKPRGMWLEISTGS